MENNLAENATLPFVVARKNWLFSSTPEGAKASALSAAGSRRPRPMPGALFLPKVHI